MNMHIRITVFWDMAKTSIKHTYTHVHVQKPPVWAHAFIFSAFSHQ